MNDIICTTVSDENEFEIFSKAKYLILINDHGEIIHKEVNPALNSSNKRPTVARRCVELKANIVLAPHGSLCYPSYMILKKAGVSMYVVNNGIEVKGGLVNKREVTHGEVIYSSFIAVIERLKEALSHG